MGMSVGSYGLTIMPIGIDESWLGLVADVGVGSLVELS